MDYRRVEGGVAAWLFASLVDDLESHLGARLDAVARVLLAAWRYLHVALDRDTSIP